MPEYIVSYHGGEQPKTPEEGAGHMKKWMAWVQGCGDAMVNPGTPVGKTKVITATGVSSEGSANPMSGFSVVKADDMDGAIELAKGCPVLDIGGTLEVSEMMQMGGGKG